MSHYVAFLDMAEGARSGDSAAMALAHREDSRVVVDVVRVVAPPFSPGEVITSQFVPVWLTYNVHEVRGDRHAVGFVREAIEAHGITFTPTPYAKAQLYAELLALLNTGLVELPDHALVKQQLLALQRRAVRGGRDIIDHPRGGHDDACNAVAGAVVHASGVVVDGKTFEFIVGAGGDHVSPSGHAAAPIPFPRGGSATAVEEWVKAERARMFERARATIAPLARRYTQRSFRIANPSRGDT